MINLLHGEISRLKAENKRLRAGLLSLTLDGTNDDKRSEMDYGIGELKDTLSGKNYDDDMKGIAKFNYDDLNIHEVEGRTNPSTVLSSCIK